MLTSPEPLSSPELSSFIIQSSLWVHAVTTSGTSHSDGTVVILPTPHLSLSQHHLPSPFAKRKKKLFPIFLYFVLFISFHLAPLTQLSKQLIFHPASLSPSSLLLWPFRIIIAFQVNFEHFCLFSPWPVNPSGFTVPAPEMMGLDAPIPLFMRQHTDEFTFQNQLAVHVKLIALALVVSRPHVFPCLFRPLSPRFSDPPLLASSLSFSLQPSLPICSSSFAPSPLSSSQERSAPSSSSSRRSPSKNPSTLCYSPLPSRSCFSPSDSHKTFCLKGVKEALSAFSCL